MLKGLLKKIIFTMGAVILCFSIPFAASAASSDPIRIYYSATLVQSLDVATNLANTGNLSDQYFNYITPYDVDFPMSQYIYVGTPSTSGIRVQLRFDSALSYYGTDFSLYMVLPAYSWSSNYISVSGSNVSITRSDRPIVYGNTPFYQYHITGDIANVDNFVVAFDIKVDSSIVSQYQGVVLPISYLDVGYTEDFSNAGYLAGIQDAMLSGNSTTAGIYSALQAVINEQAMADPDFVAGLEDLRQDVLQDYINLDEAITDFDNDFNDSLLNDDFDDAANDLIRGELPMFLSMFYTEFVGGDWFFLSISSIFGGLALFSKVVFG